MKIYWVQKSATAYLDSLYRTFHENNDIDFRVFYLWRRSLLRPWKSQFGRGYNNTYMKPLFGIDWGLLEIAWNDVESFFIVADWAHLPTVAVILARCWRQAPIAIWTDTPQQDIKRPRLKKWARDKFLRWLLPKVDIIFGTGKKALRLLQEMGASPEQLVNLPVFVNLHEPSHSMEDLSIRAEAERFRNLVGCSSGGIVFSMLGMLIPRKGQDVGLQAFADCCRQANKPLGLLIAGEGPERQHLERLANQLGLGNSVAFLGWQEPEGVEAVYLASDIVLHPARSDPYPGVILEAMSWSKVVIGSDVCGNVEDRIVSGVNGFSFPSEDVGELAKIMLHLVNHPEKLPEIGAQARKTAEEWPMERGVEIVLEQANKTLSVTKKEIIRAKVK